MGIIMVIYSYQQLINFLILTNSASFNSLVKISPRCRVVYIYHMNTILSFTKDLKWWYFNAICFVRGLMRAVSTRSMNPLLSSKIVQWMVGADVLDDITAFNSLRNYINIITYLIDWYRAIYLLFLFLTEQFQSLTCNNI